MSEGGQPVQEVSQEEQDIARTATEFPDQPHRGGPLSGQTELPGSGRHLPSVAIYARPPKARYNKFGLRAH